MLVRVASKVACRIFDISQGGRATSIARVGGGRGPENRPELPIITQKIGSSRAMHDVCLRISPVCKLKRMDQKLPPYSLAVVLFDLIQLKLKPRNIE